MMESSGINREDLWLKARVLSEGVRFEFAGVEVKEAKGLTTIILDGCGLPVMTPYNQYSRLTVAVDEDRVTVSDMGQEIGRGTTVREDFSAKGQTLRSDMVAVPVHFRCYNQDAGKGCKYCEKNADVGHIPAGNALTQAIRKSAAGVANAVENGWRGCVMLTGGVLPPQRRNRLIDRIEVVMAELRERLDADVLSQLQITANVYPPDELSELEQWRDLGINSTSFDLEVMDPAFWRAICPGKAETTTHEHWIEAMTVSAEVFGRGRGTMSAVVLGIEPLDSFIEGFEDLVSKGVYPVPYVFLPPSKRVGFSGFRPPTADWLMEATERMADILFHYADSFDVNMTEDDRPGLTRVGRSYGQIILHDEITRRLQSR